MFSDVTNMFEWTHFLEIHGCRRYSYGGITSFWKRRQVRDVVFSRSTSEEGNKTVAAFH